MRFNKCTIKVCVSVLDNVPVPPSPARHNRQCPIPTISVVPKATYPSRLRALQGSETRELLGGMEEKRGKKCFPNSTIDLPSRQINVFYLSATALIFDYLRPHKGLTLTDCPGRLRFTLNVSHVHIGLTLETLITVPLMSTILSSR